MLTGSPLTDVQITLLIRPCTIRSIRRAAISARQLTVLSARDFAKQKISFWNHIMNSGSIAGRDDWKSNGRCPEDAGSFESPETDGTTAVLKELQRYPRCAIIRRKWLPTHGIGKAFLHTQRICPCRNQEEIVKNTGYDPRGSGKSDRFRFLCTWSRICRAVGSG